MPADMPIRDTNASQATWSDRAFQSMLPDEWIVHPLSEDYGVDRRVEIVDGTRMTGFFFNVQLKSTRKGKGERPSESLKRTTLAYWAALSEPTLIVIAHKPTRRLWFKWAHHLPQEESPKGKKRRVRCDEEMTQESYESLREEAMGFRLARDLGRHLPVPIVVAGHSFYGEPASRVRAALSKRLAPLRGVVRDSGVPDVLPRIEVAVTDSGASVRIVGGPSRSLTWEFRGNRNYKRVSADITAAVGMAAAGVGAESIALKLLKNAAPDSGMLPAAHGLPFAISMLTRHGESQTVLGLMRRTAFVEGHPTGMMALAAMASGGPTESQLRSVAIGLRDSARKWSKPAMGIYNAANTLPDSESRAALDLYDEAANHEPAYRTRGYWWRERGTCFWNLGEAHEALECYEEAVRLGDDRAQPLAADVMMRTGRYREARDAFAAAPIFDDPKDAQWRLSLIALEFIVDRLGYESQARERLPPPEFHPSAVENFEVEARAALAADALNSSAHFALSVALRRDDPDSMLAAIAAAVIHNVNPEGWFFLIREMLVSPAFDTDDRRSVTYDAMVCAWKYFGPRFADYILESESVDEDARSAFLDLFEATQPEDSPFEIRVHNETGVVETVLVPARSF